MFRLRMTPLPLMIQSLKETINTLIVTLTSVSMLLWNTLWLVLSPVRWLVEPFWVAFSKKEDDIFWENMRSVTSSKIKTKGRKNASK
ncbi:hypothetical protein QTV49_001815 [Vibrio vulnificus]|nr:hypothetical protein [Vibrio vulnificus]